jgi:hypothetical protein
LALLNKDAVKMYQNVKEIEKIMDDMAGDMETAIVRAEEKFEKELSTAIKNEKLKKKKMATVPVKA